jgi:hypothetical protein
MSSGIGAIDVGFGFNDSRTKNLKKILEVVTEK